MAIFIASTKSISRGSGQSAVASASYRAGCELEDKRYGKTHNYSKKHGVMSADIILPSALAAANADVDRGELWNKAEAAEKRVDARVAREWLVNLPHELSAEDRKEIAHKFAQNLADRYGTIADCAIHQPTQKEIERGADPRNFHAHILFTTRTAEIDDNNQIILTDKATIELSDNKRRSLGMERVSHEIKEVRQIWEHIANEKLAEHDYKLMDSRSYAAQGIDIEPQLKMGSVATKLERDKYEQELKKAEQAKKEGKHYEIDKTPATQLGTINEIIHERNELVWGVALAKNQTVNDLADAIIVKGHDIEHTTPPPHLISGYSLKPSTKTAAVAEPEPIEAPTPEPKRKTPSPADIAAAMAMAHGIRAKRADEQKEKELALEQQRQREITEQKQREQAERERIEQQRADRLRQQQREQQATAERLERDNRQFKSDKKRIYESAFIKAEHGIKGVDKDKKAGAHILAISVANDVMQDLKKYSDEPTTAQTQRELAEGERDKLTDFVNDKSKQALSEIRNLPYTEDRKTHTAALQGVLTEFVDNHSQTVDKNQQQALQSVQRDVANYSNEINRSRGFDMGM
ncbi:MobA/MobL family protein [uncultured Psychrobacter sp.]|uniref:MobA/MobL family protein n=1 Tax=uncultured Psychrobacter sp. TaxID=259303 RepID=UPI002620B2F4|nr:MobA/MobL family protein [uncultured Psychrobacter sp.]